MTHNEPKLGLISVDVYTKFGQILSIRSQDIEWKPNIHGITESRNDGLTEGQGESSIAPLPTFPKRGYKKRMASHKVTTQS